MGPRSVLSVEDTLPQRRHDLASARSCCAVLPSLAVAERAICCQAGDGSGREVEGGVSERVEGAVRVVGGMSLLALPMRRATAAARAPAVCLCLFQG